MTQMENFIMRMKTGGETTFVAPKEQAGYCESLRQKNSCLTHLWRVLFLKATKGDSLKEVNFQVPGQRPTHICEGGLCPFCCTHK
jgi:hypothetical protein